MWNIINSKKEETTTTTTTTTSSAIMKLTARNRGHHIHNHQPSSSSSPASSGGGASSTATSPLHSSPIGPIINGSFTSQEYDKLTTRRPNNKSSFSATATAAGGSCGGLWKRIWHRWRLLNVHSKIVTALLLFVLFQHVIIGIWDRSFHQIGIIQNNNSSNNHGATKSQETEFAVVINTYKRPDMLRRAIQHYADKCGKRYHVGQVFVIWAEQGVELPTPESFFEDGSLRKSTSNDHKRSPVRVLQMSKDSLNSRFEPISQLQTTSVFMVDDDIRVSCPSLSLAFQAWKSNPDSMVGYYPRLSSKPIRHYHQENEKSSSSSSSSLVYHAWPIVYWKDSFNFVLTKASFLHSKYLELYTNDETFPKEIKDHVDKHMNCEDIAMSMLVANHTKYQSSTGKVAVRPIYVEGRVTDLGLFGGISTGSGHMTTRSDCLTQLTSIFRQHGWDDPFNYEYKLSDSSWIRHSPGFWWQNSPSNFFEWFAFANTFT
jgi:glucuronyl/N-acetylglucosaminyl transferase EXT2